jgi:ComF family protein
LSKSGPPIYFQQVIQIFNFLDLLFPQRCIFCGKIMPPGGKICAGCKTDAYLIGPDICPKCGRDAGKCSCAEDAGALCFDSCIAPFYYTGSAKSAILRFKFQGLPQNGPFLAKFIYDRIEEKYSGLNFDFISFVPSHPEKKKARGYNQSEILAINAAKYLCLPLEGEVLVKTANKTPQHELTRAERFKNIAGTFSAPKPRTVSGKKILLIDDILTTGSTLGECAKTLKAAGAEEVRAAVFAATNII